MADFYFHKVFCTISLSLFNNLFFNSCLVVDTREHNFHIIGNKNTIFMRISIRAKNINYI